MPDTLLMVSRSNRSPMQDAILSISTVFLSNASRLRLIPFRPTFEVGWDWLIALRSQDHSDAGGQQEAASDGKYR